ncbi:MULTISPECIES: SMP-30/gluconolactonase/LRE family protein [unclassified Variovorax]|uniref:SMP-30/gluconolactonase/LRE family protein n=1 Tax=unclassified Variovorax TaxID=663243 RepID=UPI002B23D480|nr:MULTISPECIES: SMP-30/gluconolactonase/LRE family protein [unclassified Variovorax]MEB0058439.1 SMP-30/gluconolactonase/LRE family protein [Variovorax sp. LG9.2]MEB0111240.1 SMP-30/gluconolactonase/LRE family protein [Variovorax sp. RTB1]
MHHEHSSAAGAVRRVGSQTDILGESPLWDDRGQCLYWVDIRRPAIRRLLPSTGQVDTWEMPELVGCIALTDEGRLLVALSQFIALFDVVSGSLEALARPRQSVPGHRFNDGRCDRQGRFWVGTMHNLTRAPEGVLYRLEGRGELAPMRDGICIPNSLAFSPDGCTMYFADSLRYSLYAYDYDPETGRTGTERVLATTAEPAFPDGSTVDEEGFLWNAEFNGARLVRYAPDGRIDRTIAMPVQRPTCCAFGGPDLRTLYVTTTSQKMTPEQLAAEPLAGALLALDVGVAGLPEPRFLLDRKIDCPSLRKTLK